MSSVQREFFSLFPAAQWDGSRESIKRLCRWVNDKVTGDDPILSYTFTASDDVDDVRLWTQDGQHIVSPGDWIIRGQDGEYLVCTPKVFERESNEQYYLRTKCKNCGNEGNIRIPCGKRVTEAPCPICCCFDLRLSACSGRPVRVEEETHG